MSRVTYCSVSSAICAKNGSSAACALRGRPARAAPGRRASSRSAAPASCRRPSSDGSRRRCDRACRPSPSPGGSAAPCRRAAVVAGARVLAQQEQQLARPRELRRVAEPAAPLVEDCWNCWRVSSRARRSPGGGDRPARCHRGEPRRRSRRGGLHDLPRPRARRGAISLQHIHEAGPSPLRRRRKIGAAVERLQIGGQPHAHRPAAGAGRRLHERHVDAIHVRTFFAIELHRHEVAFSTPRSPRSSNDSCSMTWHQWQVA